MSKLLLPIDHNPVFISRYESAVPFSVIQARQISIEPMSSFLKSVLMPGKRRRMKSKRSEDLI